MHAETDGAATVLQAHAQLLDPANYESIESDLTWLGVAGLLDPPRPEVRGAIEDCVLAGIRVRAASASGGHPSALALRVKLTCQESLQARSSDSLHAWERSPVCFAPLWGA